MLISRQEILPDAKPVRLEERAAHEKRVRARSARQPRRLEIDEEQGARRTVERLGHPAKQR